MSRQHGLLPKTSRAVLAWKLEGCVMFLVIQQIVFKMELFVAMFACKLWVAMNFHVMIKCTAMSICCSANFARIFWLVPVNWMHCGFMQFQSRCVTKHLLTNIALSFFDLVMNAFFMPQQFCFVSKLFAAVALEVANLFMRSLLVDLQHMFTCRFQSASGKITFKEFAIDVVSLEMLSKRLLLEKPSSASVCKISLNYKMFESFTLIISYHIQLFSCSYVSPHDEL